MPVTREEAARAVESHQDCHLVVTRIDNGKTLARRPGRDGERGLIVAVGRIGLDEVRAGRRTSIRPSRGAAGDERSWYTPEAWREVQRRRNKHVHAARVRTAQRGGARPRQEATTAPHGAPDGRERPGARAAVDKAPTRPEIRVI